MVLVNGREGKGGVVVGVGVGDFDRERKGRSLAEMRYNCILPGLIEKSQIFTRWFFCLVLEALSQVVQKTRDIMMTTP